MQQTDYFVRSPLRYQPDYEVVSNPARTRQQHLQQTLRKLSEITSQTEVTPVRSVHQKSHGLLSAEMQVYDQLPPAYAQGLFARPQTLPLVMRFSTVPGDILHDNPGTPRSLALKVVGVDGERLPGSEDAITQNFLLVNGASFLSSSVQIFLNHLKHLACTPNTNTEFRQFLAQLFRATAHLVQSLKHGQPSKINHLPHLQETNLLGETYISQDPIMYGDYMAKIAVVPIAPELIALRNKPIDLFTSDGLRKSMVDFFVKRTAVWELRVQLCTDLQIMPIEDATIVWPEDHSPYLPVARITAKPQIAWSPYRSKLVDEGMLFSPWQGLASHRPLGSVTRLRKMSYEMAKNLRGLRENGHLCEPRHLDDLC